MLITPKGKKVILWLLSVAVVSITLNAIREKQIIETSQYDADQKALNDATAQQNELWSIVELGHKQAIKVVRARMLAEGWQPPKEKTTQANK